MGSGEAHRLVHPRGSGLSLPRTKTGPGGHSSVWEVPYQMFEGGEKKSHFLSFFFSFYFLIIFLDDFISKKGVGERRRTGGLRKDEMGRVGVKPREKSVGELRATLS